MHGVLNIYSFGGSTEPIGTSNLLFLTQFWRRSWRRTITSSNIFLTHSLSTFSDCTYLYIVPSAVVLLVPQSLLFFSSFCVSLIGLDHCYVHIYFLDIVLFKFKNSHVILFYIYLFSVNFLFLFIMNKFFFISPVIVTAGLESLLDISNT